MSVTHDIDIEQCTEELQSEQGSAEAARLKGPISLTSSCCSFQIRDDNLFTREGIAERQIELRQQKSSRVYLLNTTYWSRPGVVTAISGLY